MPGALLKKQDGEEPGFVFFSTLRANWREAILQVFVTARHSGITGGAKDYASRKVENLDRLFHGVTKIEIVLDAAARKYWDGARG